MKKYDDMIVGCVDAEGLNDPLEELSNDIQFGHHEFIAPDGDLYILSLEQRLDKAKERLAEVEEDHRLCGVAWKEAEKARRSWKEPHINAQYNLEDSINPHFEKVEDLKRKGRYLALSCLYWEQVIENTEDSLVARDNLVYQEPDVFIDDGFDKDLHRWKQGNASKWYQAVEKADAVIAAQLIEKLGLAKKKGFILGRDYCNLAIDLARKAHQDWRLKGLIKYLRCIEAQDKAKAKAARETVLDGMEEWDISMADWVYERVDLITEEVK